MDVDILTELSLLPLEGIDMDTENMSALDHLDEDEDNSARACTLASSPILCGTSDVPTIPHLTDAEDPAGMSDAIRVVCRFKPMQSSPRPSSSIAQPNYVSTNAPIVDIQSSGGGADGTPGICILQCRQGHAGSLASMMLSGPPSPSSTIPTDEAKQASTFSFDRIFNPDATQEDVYHGCRGQSLVKGTFIPSSQRLPNIEGADLLVLFGKRCAEWVECHHLCVRPNGFR